MTREKARETVSMRIVLASLFAATALVSVAQAQTPATPATQPAPAAQTPPAAPTTTAPAETPPSTTTAPATTPSTTAPTDATAQPAAPAAPAAEAAPPPPTVPTTGDGAQLLQVVEKICVPLVRGGNLDNLMKANPTLGFKKNRRDNSWSAQLGTTDKNYNVTISPPGANKDVCQGEVHYALNQDKPIVEAINIWSFLHQPELILQANYVAVDPDGVKRVRKSWEALNAASSTAVNFSTWTKPDDSSLNAKFSTGEIFYQERKLG
jgi:hypothetical protein